MAFENIQIAQPNFCRGPQLGTICTVDTTNLTTVLKVKDTGGGTIVDLTFSSNILYDDVRVEYVGPTNLTGLVDDLVFFTFERVSDTTCIIKRWQTRMSYNELLLKEQVVKYNIGLVSYNAIDFAVEYYNRTFTKGNEYYNYLYMSDTTNIKNGTRLFLGPSSDTDNLGATETVTVSHIADIHGEDRVYLTSYIQNQYAIGDFVSAYTHVYIYSRESVPGDGRSGSLIKHDAYSWSVAERDIKNFYRNVTASKWCPQVQAIASVVETNMIFVRPYDSYQNWRSMYLNNVQSDKITVFDVYDVVFDAQTVYKLQSKTTLKDDDGEHNTVTWSTYNYQEDTLAPYSNNITLWMEQSIATGFYKTLTIYARVRDQYHVGLKDVTVNFYIEDGGDDEAYLWPLSGLATTDKDGLATIDYRTGHDYYGTTYVKARATGSSAATGSAYTWCVPGIAIITYPWYPDVIHLIYQFYSESGYILARQLDDPYKYYAENELGEGESFIPDIALIARNYFTTPGGRWGDNLGDEGNYVPQEEVGEYLPELYLGNDKHTDGPAYLFGGYGFSAWPVDITNPDDPYLWANQIRIVESFNSNNNVRHLSEYKIHHGISDGASIEEGWYPYVYIKQPDETGHLQISQLKLSLHTHWVDGVPQDELTTYVTVDQFVFVEDAIPKFWSEKNPISTDIWIRLRPFAFSLDNDTLRMWIRVVSQTGDTNYQEVTDDVELDNFDAGGGLLGIEVLYNPPEDLPYGALVFIRIEVYDEAAIPNFIFVEYWFYTTPDYKAPYLTNLSPSREEINVAVDTSIYFEIKDNGAGIDMDNLEFLLNSRIMNSNYVTIEVVSSKHIKVTYTPPENLFFSKDYKVTVKAVDSSPQENRMNDAYTFYTVDSTGVYVTDPNPSPCKRGMQRFEDVSAVVLADGNGIDRGTVRMQVFNKDVHPRITPIVYRIS